MRRLALHLMPLLVLAIFGAAACTATASQGPVDTGNAPTAPAASSGGGAGGACAKAEAGATATVTVEYKDFKPSPDPATAKVGDVVGWTNGDAAAHTATLDDGSCGTDNISQGATGLLVFNEPGTYTYHCAIHSSMKDFKITVTE